MRASPLLLTLLLSLSLLPTSQLRADTLVRFVTQHFPPFSYIEQGQVSGPARALIDRACEATQAHCVHQLLPWQRAQKMVQLGRQDAMYVIGANPDRDRWVLYSRPLLTTEYGFFVRGDDPLHSISAEALEGYHVAALAASNTLKSLQRLRDQGMDFEIIEVSDSQTGFRLLDVGRVSAVYSNRDVGYSLIRAGGYQQMHYAVADRKLDYFIGFNPELVESDWLDAFNQQLERMAESGETERILRTYGLK
ncbi:substrate-binding periplasmic protein [Motiliproteus sp.]|uniref:substrate-binding periplasmic protein n=1 Tax=Motiliproteus sp. TaxID=1898955 RepID=UPI003BAAF960